MDLRVVLLIVVLLATLAQCDYRYALRGYGEPNSGSRRAGG
jgi:hypothetical protein